MPKNTDEPIETQSPSPRPAPRWLNLLIVALGLSGLVLLLVFYDQALPTAAIDLSLSRAEIAQRAQAYLEERGYDTSGYKFALTFGEDSWASYYLQRTLGIPATNRLIRETQVPIWYWSARWFRPLQKEELRVYLAPDGQVVALSHVLLEDDPGADLPQEKARQLALDYLSQDRAWNLDDWEEVSASSEDRPGGRTDHSFVWKRRDWDVGASELRLAVTVKGDEIGYYDYWLKVPEAFQRDFAQQRNVAGFINNWSLCAAFTLFGLLLLLALWRARWRVPVSFSAALGPALAVAAVTMLAEMNELPLAKSWYTTTENYVLFWLGWVLNIAMWAFYNGLVVFVLWIVGHWLSQRVWPHQDRILPRRGDRWRSLALSGGRGLMLGGMMGGYLVLFYLAATHLVGGWVPMYPDATRAYATPLPFLSALEIGLLPAMWEELAFRLIGISAILWFTRTFTRLPEAVCRFLALLVPGALWAFAHLAYIRDPFYLRGIELTIAAVLLEGLFFLRFDLTTTIVAHFVYNAGLGALPLLRSGDPWFVISGVVVILAMLSPMMPYTAREVWCRLRGRSRRVLHPRIRPANVGDLETLAALPVQGLELSDLLNMPEATVLCLEAGDEIVGLAVGQLAATEVGKVLRVYVAPSWRRRYWGSELLQALCAHLREQGAGSIQAEASVGDKEATQFMIGQEWKQVRVTFGWPVEPPSFPAWRAAVRKAGSIFGSRSALGSKQQQSGENRETDSPGTVSSRQR